MSWTHIPIPRLEREFSAHIERVDMKAVALVRNQKDKIILSRNYRYDWKYALPIREGKYTVNSIGHELISAMATKHLGVLLSWHSF